MVAHLICRKNIEQLFSFLCSIGVLNFKEKKGWKRVGRRVGRREAVRFMVKVDHEFIARVCAVGSVPPIYVLCQVSRKES